MSGYLGNLINLQCRIQDLARPIGWGTMKLYQGRTISLTSSNKKIKLATAFSL